VRLNFKCHYKWDIVVPWSFFQHNESVTPVLETVPVVGMSGFVYIHPFVSAFQSAGCHVVAAIRDPANDLAAQTQVCLFYTNQ